MKYDLYDANMKKIGKTIDEKNIENIEDGQYHLSLNIWIINSKKEVLLLKKSINYDYLYPKYWTSINYNVLTEQNIEEAILQALEEKIGIMFQKIKYKDIGTILRDPYHYMFQTIIINEDLESNISLNKERYSKYEWVNLEKLVSMMENGEIEWPLIERIERLIIPLLKK